MTGENYLLTLAATGMTLGGFTGLINAFRAAGRDWLPQERAAMKLIFQHSLGAVFFGFLPFSIFFTSGREPLAWFISSAFLACFLLFEFVFNMVQVIRMTKAGTPPRRRWYLFLHFFPLTLLAFVLQVLNLCYWWGAWPYFWGVFWLLQPPAVQFYHFISFMKVPAVGSRNVAPNVNQPNNALQRTTGSDERQG